MSSTFSTNLAIELIGTGDQAGVWGNTTNTNLGTLIEQAISGYVTQAVSTGTDTTITIPNGATGVARNMYIELTGTGGASTNLIVPANKKLYFIFNNTSSGQVTVKVSGQTGVSVPNKAKMVLVSNGTDIVDATNYVGNLSAASANITVLTSASATITNLLATSLTVSSGSTLNGGVVINEPGADVDTRIEGDTDANLFFADASTDRIGIGTNAPTQKLTVAAAGKIEVLRSDNARGGQLFADGNGTHLVALTTGNDPLFLEALGESDIRFTTSASEKMRLNSSGNLGLGVTPAGWTTYKAMQFSTTGAIAAASGGDMVVGNNYYYDGANKYLTTAPATFYYQYNGAHSWHNAPSGTAGTAATFTQAMTLDASGNLGVGTSSPGNRLHVSGNSGDLVRVSGAAKTLYINCDSGGGGIFTGAAQTGPAYYLSDTNGYAAIFTSSTERARITSGGYSKFSNSGSYVSSTGSYHEVDQSIDGISLYVYASNSTTYSSDVLYVKGERTTTNSTYSLINAINGNSSGRFVVRDSGNCANTNNSFGAISDVKVKQDIVDAASQWDDIKGIRVRKFRFKNDPAGPLQIGVVAQELEQVSPGLVDGEPDYEEIEVTDAEGNVTKERQPTGTTTKSVKYSVLYMKAVKALQEAMARIESLEAKVAALEAK